MIPQRKKHVVIKSILNDFLNDINYCNVFLPPCSNDPRRLAAQARGKGRRFQSFQMLSGKDCKGRKRLQSFRILSGRDLMKENIKQEAKRLKLHSSHMAYLVNLATQRIWNSHSNYFQRRGLETLAADANKINRNMTSFNNDDTINRMTRMITPITPQEATNYTETDFINGLSQEDFYSKNVLESLVLPAGFGSPDFP